MNSELARLTSGLTRSDTKATVEVIRSAQSTLGIQRLPDDYVEFLLASDGAEGKVGSAGYISIWSIARVLSYNLTLEYRVLPRLMFFASDGGSEYYAFDASSPGVRILEVPSVGPDPNDVRKCGSSLEELLRHNDESTFVTPETEAAVAAWLNQNSLDTEH